MCGRYANHLKSLYSCAILTREAVVSLVGIHPRMPLILGREDARNWLQLSADSLQQTVGERMERLQRYTDYPLVVRPPVA